MDDRFPKDGDSARADFVVLEGGPGEEAINFSAQEQRDQFLGGGGSGEPPKPKGKIIPESGTAVDRQEQGFDIRDKTIPLSDLEINFPYNEDLPAGRKRETRFMNLNSPDIFSKQIKANAKYLRGVKEEKAEEVIDELKRRGHNTNLLVRGLGGFYDEKSPPIKGVMNFHDLQDMETGKDAIVNALTYAVDTRLIRNAAVTDGDYYSEELKQEFLKRPVAIMVADRTKSTKIRDDAGYYDYDITPDAVIAIFTFHIDDPLVRDSIK